MFGQEVLRELGKHDRERFAEKLADHAQPAAMRHAHADLLHAVARAAFQQPVERGDERLAALDGEALLPHVARVQEVLEGLHGKDLPQHPLLRFRRELARRRRALSRRSRTQLRTRGFWMCMNSAPMVPQ